MRKSGFTILELSIVILIILVASVIGFPWLIQSSRSQDLKALTNEIVANINILRTTTMSSNEQTSFTVSADFKSYILTTGSGSSAISRSIGVDGSTYEVGFANNNTANAIVNTITYTSPYAEVNSSVSTAIRVKRKDGNVPPMYIKIVGVTGKVIKSARDTN